MHSILRATRIALLAASLVCGMTWAQAPVNINAQDEAVLQQLLQGAQLLRGGKIQEAITQGFDPVIEYYERTYRNSKSRVYSSRSLQESMFYLLSAYNAHAQGQPDADAAVYSENWGNAYYLKAYALIEIKQLPAAKAALQAAIALAPRNAQFLGELGTLHLIERDWDAAMKIFASAETAAREFSSKELRAKELTLALRGQGFVLIETNQLEEAEKRYFSSLEIDPNDKRARGQLAYIQQRQTAAQAGPLRGPLSKLAGDIVTIAQAWSAAEAQNADPLAQDYARQWGSGGGIWNDNGIQKRAVMPQEKAMLECITAHSPAPESVRMVFTLDEQGLVAQTFTDQTGYVAECIQTKLSGHRVPVPPKVPYYFCAQYQKRGDSGNATAGCGPQHFVRICERKATSISCTVSQR